MKKINLLGAFCMGLVSTAYALDANQVECQIKDGSGGNLLSAKTLTLNGTDAAAYLSAEAKIGSQTYNYVLSINQQSGSMTLNFGYDLFEQTVLQPGQKVGYTIFDGFGGPEPDLHCERGGTDNAPTIAKKIACKADAVTAAEVIGQAPQVKRFPVQSAAINDQYVGMGFGDSLFLNANVSPHSVSFVVGDMQEHVLPEIDMSLAHGQRVAIRKTNGGLNFKDFICEAF